MDAQVLRSVAINIGQASRSSFKKTSCAVERSVVNLSKVFFRILNMNNVSV